MLGPAYISIGKIEFSEKISRTILILTQLHIQKVIWIANKHLHNYNLQNNPQYQVISCFMLMIMARVILVWTEDDNIECGQHLV